MKCFGSPTPKRSALWSNSDHIGIFRGRKLSKKRGGHQPRLVKHYRDTSGRKRFQGIRKNLKKSGTHGYAWFVHFNSFHLIFSQSISRFEPSWPLLDVHLRAYPLGFALRYLKYFDHLGKNRCRLRQKPLEADVFSIEIHMHIYMHAYKLECLIMHY